jgi:prepilin-type N-terminal cleavage/methylation domain-containing protein
VLSTTPQQLIEPLDVRRHRGFTLFEILVTILVVSIGLLGIAKILASGLRSDERSQERREFVQPVAGELAR